MRAPGEVVRAASSEGLTASAARWAARRSMEDDAPVIYGLEFQVGHLERGRCCAA